MTDIARLAIDTSKSVFTLHGVDVAGRAILRRNLRRRELLRFFERLPSVEVALEACGGSHYWARALLALGQRVRLIPPQYVKPFVKRSKNDRNDAEAISVAAAQPSIGSVLVESAEQQAAAMLLSVRELLVRQRTLLANAMRGHAAEMGVVAPLGEKGLRELQAEVAAADDAAVRRHADATAQDQSGEPAAGCDPGDWADRGAEFCAAGRSGAVRIGAPLRRLARAGSAGMLDRGQTASGRHQSGWR